MKKDKKAANAPGDKSSVKELNPWPAYIQHRMDMWDKLKVKYAEELANKPQTPIKVTLPDGKVVDAIAWNTTAYDIAKGIRYKNILFS